MNKKLYITLGIIAITSICLWAVWSQSQVSIIKKEGLNIGGQSYLSRVYTALATSSVAYMTPGTASTTLSIGQTGNVDKVDLYVQQISSTSASVLTTSFEVSNNNVDWTVASTSNWSGSASASTTRLVLAFPDYASNFKRVVFYDTVGNLSVWAEAVLKSNSY